MTDDETIALRATVIAGKRYDDDFTVIWRGLSIGRIMLGHSGHAFGKRLTLSRLLVLGNFLGQQSHQHRVSLLVT